MENFQSLKNKLGEVRFRKKLLLQHKGRGNFYPTQPTETEILDLLRERANDSLKIFKKLQKKKILLSPFLELGAERCQRAAVLITKFNANGVGLDISAESLESASYFCPKIGLNKLPLRICADAYNLPFADNSIPFIFTFQTLHHFPDPAPVVAEVYRVLAPGGYFYIDEEPVKQGFNIPLWRRDYHLRWWETFLKMSLILPFISQIGGSEVSEGVLEESFDLKTWERALEIFGEAEITLTPFPFGPESKSLMPNFITRILLYLSGGGISALCKKPGKLDSIPKDISSCFKKNFRAYKKDRVLYMLPKNLREKLYPQIK